MCQVFRRSLRIVDDDSGLDDDGNDREGGLRVPASCGLFDGGKTTLDSCLFRGKLVALTKGFDEAEIDGFLNEC